MEISEKKLKKIRERIESTEPEPFIKKNSTMTFGKKIVIFFGIAGLLVFLIAGGPFILMSFFKYIPS